MLTSSRPYIRTPLPCTLRLSMEGHNVVTAKGKGKNHYGKRFSKKHKAVSVAGVGWCGAVQCDTMRCGVAECGVG